MICMIIAQLIVMQQADSQPLNKKGVIFGVIAILYQILVCAVYVFIFEYDQTVLGDFEIQDAYLILGLMIFSVLGFGLLNAYNFNDGFSGISLTMLTFALCIQHYFIFKYIWEASKINQTPIQYRPFEKIRLISPRQDPTLFEVSSVANAIIVTICAHVAMFPFMKVMHAIQIFIVTILVAFFYQLNAQILHKVNVMDVGFGMRVFLLGSIISLVVYITNFKHFSIDSHKIPIYCTRAFGIMGNMFLLAAFPFLSAVDLYKTTPNLDSELNNNHIAQVAIINVYFACVAGVLGSYAAVTILNGMVTMNNLPLTAFTVILTIMQGGIVYSSSCNLHKNPAIPLAAGFLTGFLAACIREFQNKRDNKSWINILNPFVIPSVFAVILSAILSQEKIQVEQIFQYYKPSLVAEQASLQMAGLGITIVVGVVAGIVIGVLARIIRIKNIEWEPIHEQQKNR